MALRKDDLASVTKELARIAEALERLARIAEDKEKRDPPFREQARR